MNIKELDITVWIQKWYMLKRIFCHNDANDNSATRERTRLTQTGSLHTKRVNQCLVAKKQVLWPSEFFADSHFGRKNYLVFKDFMWQTLKIKLTISFSWCQGSSRPFSTLLNCQVQNASIIIYCPRRTVKSLTTSTYHKNSYQTMIHRAWGSH
jgi:hypothetical protein